VDDNVIHVEVTGAFTLPEDRRPDGYLPITLALGLWAGLYGVPRGEPYRYLWSAAMRLDTAHRTIERARVEIDAYHRSPSGAPEDALGILGDVQVAIVALHRAVEMARAIPTLFGPVSVTFPRSVEDKREALEQLRDAYEHIDERARGRIDRAGTVDLREAESLFINAEFGKPLIETGTVQYRLWSLDIHDETTSICRAVRKFLHNAYIEIFERELAEHSDDGERPRFEPSVLRENQTTRTLLCGICLREKNLGLRGRGWTDDEKDEDIRFVVELPLGQEEGMFTCSHGHEHYVVREGSDAATYAAQADD
jgi:hypothetical protein